MVFSVARMNGKETNVVLNSWTPCQRLYSLLPVIRTFQDEGSKTAVQDLSFTVSFSRCNLHWSFSSPVSIAFLWRCYMEKVLWYIYSSSGNRTSNTENNMSLQIRTIWLGLRVNEGASKRMHYSLYSTILRVFFYVIREGWLKKKKMNIKIS